MNATVQNKCIKEAVCGLKKLAARHVENVVRITARQGYMSFTMDNGEERLTYMTDDADIQIAGETAVRLDELAQHTKSRNTGDAVINVTGDQAVIRYVKAGAEQEHPLTVMPVPEYDAIPAKGKPVGPKFLELLQRAFVCASSDITRPTLHGAYLDVTKGDHRIVCTDGKRLSAFRCELPIKRSAVIPATKLLMWPRLSGDAAIAVTDKVFRLNAGPWTYVVKLIEGTFPDWRAVVPAEENTHMDLSDEQRDALVELIDGLTGKDDAVGLCKRSGQIALCTQKADGKGYDALPAGAPNGDGYFPAVFVGRAMLRDMLYAGFTSLGYTGESAPLVSRTPEGHLHVLMPFRCDEDNGKQVEQAVAKLVGVRVTEKTKKIEQQKKGATAMKQKEQPATQDEGSAIDRLQDTYRVAREKVKEANSALTDFAVLLREVVKEDRLRQNEIKQVRAGLSKLQAIHV